jgi:hypothetical protein
MATVHDEAAAGLVAAGERRRLEWPGMLGVGCMAGCHVSDPGTALPATVPGLQRLAYCTALAWDHPSGGMYACQPCEIVRTDGGSSSFLHESPFKCWEGDPHELIAHSGRSRLRFRGAEPAGRVHWHIHQPLRRHR